MTTVFVCAYPKAGSSWCARLLGDVLNSPVGAVFPPSDSKGIATEGQGRPGGYYIRQGHPMPVEDEGGPVVPRIHQFAYKNLTDEKIVFMLRDPRDICVSGAHHWQRPLLDYIRCVGEGKWPMTHGGGMVPFVRTWLDSGLPHCVTSYERLRGDTAVELRHILSEIGIEPVRDIDKAVSRQSLENRRKWTRQHGDRLNYGKDFQLRFLRKGIVGDWKNVMGEAEIALCDHYFGELMDDLGYK